MFYKHIVSVLRISMKEDNVYRTISLNVYFYITFLSIASMQFLKHTLTLTHHKL